jgi:hypothetical protein
LIPARGPVLLLDVPLALSGFIFDLHVLERCLQFADNHFVRQVVDDQLREGREDRVRLTPKVRQEERDHVGVLGKRERPDRPHDVGALDGWMLNKDLAAWVWFGKLTRRSDLHGRHEGFSDSFLYDDGEITAMIRELAHVHPPQNPKFPFHHQPPTLLQPGAPRLSLSLPKARFQLL